MTVKIYCGDQAFLDGFIKQLELKGIMVDDQAKLQLLIDRPLDWASLEHPEIDYSDCVILTDNQCPAYQLNLIQQKPKALMYLEINDLLLILKGVDMGYISYPAVRTNLTTVECQILRMVALGYSNEKIAVVRKVKEGTVKNSLVEIYEKLNLSSRVEAAHYYFGNWHLLQEWKPTSSTHHSLSPKPTSEN